MQRALRGRRRCGTSAATTRPIRVRYARTLDAAIEASSEYRRIGLELLGTQASDRMVSEPTTFTKAWFDAFPDAVDAAPLLARANDQDRAEIARLRIAGEIACQAMRHVRRSSSRA
jgi:hypothetical protein